MKRALAAIACLLCLASFAAANWAMTPAIYMFTGWTTLAYVIAVILVEIWIIGKQMEHLSWGRIAVMCIIANFITAVMGLMCAFPTLDFVMVGDLINPNPLQIAAKLLLVFGIASGLIESLVWMTERKEMSRMTVLRNTMLAHLVSVPVGLFIFLLPPRPYEGLEHVTSAARRLSLSRHLNTYGKKLGAGLPFSSAKTGDEFLNEIGNDQLVLSAYVPNYSRFDTHEMKREPLFEFNKSLAGRNLSYEKNVVWIFRHERSDAYGWVYDPSNGRIKSVSALKMLGY